PSSATPTTSPPNCSPSPDPRRPRLEYTGLSTPLRPPLFDRRRLQHSFGRAAAAYAEVAMLQREAESRLLEQLEVLEERVPARILDVGSGPGRASGVMKGRWPKAEVVAMDIALPMLGQVPKHT